MKVKRDSLLQKDKCANVFFFFYKIAIDRDLRTVRGKLFHSHGAAVLNARSP